MVNPDGENSWAEKDFENVQYDVKGRQYFRRRPRRVADVLSQLMARKGYSQTKSKDNLDEAWQIAVGPRFTKTTRAGTIRRGVLEIIVANSASIQQLGFQKRQLLSALQQQLPEAKIKDLRFSIGNVAQI